MQKINTLIVDDESLARERIRELLITDPDIILSGEAENGPDALDAIIKLKPDLIFLDIQMPGLNGFEVISKLSILHMPEIIFVTAYDIFAIKAFEVNAIDYLLKPFDKERFYISLQKAKSHISTKKSDQLNINIQSLLQQITNPRQKYRSRFVVKNAGRISFVEATDIDWFEAEGNYIKLHIAKKNELIRETIKNIEEQLDPELFIRVHRKNYCHKRDYQLVQQQLQNYNE